MLGVIIMRHKLFIILTFLSLGIRAQNVTTFSDTLHVATYLDRNQPEIDTAIDIIDGNHYSVPWKVYFDQNKTKLAYESIIHGDTCTEFNYWRSNGKLKRKMKYYKLPNEDFYVWVYEEIYCENSQLIRKGNHNNKGTEHIINYYCNGKKKNEFTFVDIDWEGLFTTWYESGQKETEGQYSKNQKQGEWRYWDETGKIKLIENYKDGKLLEKKK